MGYYFKKTITGKSFDEVIEQVTATLKEEGFGVLTEVRVNEVFKNKLDLDFMNYRILGACNPNFAHKAITAEPGIGVFLPCSVVVREPEAGTVEVFAVDPVASMMAVENPALEPIASEVRERMERVANSL